MKSLFSWCWDNWHVQRDGFLVHIVITILIAALVGGAILVSIPLAFVIFLGLMIAMLLLFKPEFVPFILIPIITMTSGMVRGSLIPMLRPNEPLLLISVGISLPYIAVYGWRSLHLKGPIIISTIGLVLGTIVIPYLGYFVRGISLSAGEQMKLLAPLQYLLLFFLLRSLPIDTKNGYRLVAWMLVWSGIVALIGLLQGLRIGPVLDLLDRFYYSSHIAVSDFGRVTSVLGAWNSFGVFMMICLIIARGFITSNHKYVPQNIFLIIVIILFAGLIVSGSYAGIIGLVLGYVIISIFERTVIKSLIVLLMLGIVMLPVLLPHIAARVEQQFSYGGVIPSTLMYRFLVWKDVFIPIIKETWVLGFSPELPPYLAWHDSESQYFALLLQGGIFSLIGHLFWVIVLTGWAYKQCQSSDDLTRRIARILFTLFLVMSILGLTNDVFTFSVVIEYIWILLAVLVGFNLKSMPALLNSEALTTEIEA